MNRGLGAGAATLAAALIACSDASEPRPPITGDDAMALVDIPDTCVIGETRACRFRWVDSRGVLHCPASVQVCLDGWSYSACGAFGETPADGGP